MLTLVPSTDTGDVLAGVEREPGRHETFRFFRAGVPVYPAWTERRPYLHHGGGAFLHHFGRRGGRGPTVDDGDGDDDNGINNLIPFSFILSLYMCIYLF